MSPKSRTGIRNGALAKVCQAVLENPGITRAECEALLGFEPGSLINSFAKASRAKVIEAAGRRGIHPRWYPRGKAPKIERPVKLWQAWPPPIYREGARQ